MLNKMACLPLIAYDDILNVILVHASVFVWLCCYYYSNLIENKQNYHLRLYIQAQCTYTYTYAYALHTVQTHGKYLCV